MISEDHPTDPISAYGITKLAAEKYLQLFHRLHDLPSITLRLANPFGPGQAEKGIQGAIAVLSNVFYRVGPWKSGAMEAQFATIFSLTMSWKRS
ncbi:NAD-dependent epimerase/dehydratase family protein [Ochrobactrum oryzae]|nr:NAD-dependent epimerase/dehydratase family protein [Brucella oryzae]